MSRWGTEAWACLRGELPDCLRVRREFSDSESAF